jgi:outer membrane protein assembly factor BamB
MRKRSLTFLLLWSAAALAQPLESNWPQFRGADASGIAAGSSLPVAWNAATSEGIRWRADVPGLGVSSPILWEDKLFLTTAVSEADKGDVRTGLYGDIDSVQDASEHSWKVLCYDKHTGELLWEREVHRGVPSVKRHTKSSHANATPATDGRYLAAFFGSEGLYCLDLDGNVLWKKDYGVLDGGYFKAPEAQWEFGNSPTIHDGKLIVLADVQRNSFLAVLNLEDGKEVWRVERNDVPTWGTPQVVTAGGRTQIVVNGYRHAGAYDFETGEEIWRVHGGGDIPVPTPIFGHGLFFLTNAHGGMSPVYAVKQAARGEIELSENPGNGLAWIAHRAGSYMQTPLLVDGLLYVPRWNGVLNCFRPQTGELVYETRVGTGAFTASPIAGDGKIYIANEEGTVYVVQAGADYKLLAANSLGEPTLATPAISEGVLYFRTTRSLIAVQHSRGAAR